MMPTTGPASLDWNREAPRRGILAGSLLAPHGPGRRKAVGNDCPRPQS